MAYTYRNKKTGEEIMTTNKVTGKNWEPAEEENLYAADEMENPFEDVFEEDPAAETEEGDSAEEAPAPKANSSRKGKK